MSLLFWFCVLAMAYSYVLFPMLLGILAAGKKPNGLCYDNADPALPTVSILMAAYNEERVIGEKIESVFASDYPMHKLEFFIGSDNSSDRTHEIVERFQQQYPNLHLRIFKNRQGKPNILNQMHHEAKGDIYLFTDANVFFTPGTIFEMVKHFKNEDISQVGANFQNKTVSQEGISKQEKQYIQRETLIKYQEGILWGAMMGAFGGAHAVRAIDFVANPPSFIVEDFYLSMHILSRGKKAILEPAAIVHEDLPDRISDEGRRKARISTGNFQNLAAWFGFLIKPSAVSFCFWSHKGLRWLGPFFLLGAWVSSAILSWQGSVFYQLAFALQTFLYLGTPLLDQAFKLIPWHFKPLRLAVYFVAMNVALLKGFYKFLTGVKSNVWQPTVRQN